MKTGLRITGGEYKGFVIDRIPSKNVRPTTERLRKSIFDILNGEWTGVVGFDLFAGSGIVGLEMLSRGAQYIYFVERDLTLVKYIRNQLKILNMLSRAEVVHGNVITLLRSFLRMKKCHIIYMDPPYQSELADSAVRIISENSLWKNATILVEHFFKDFRIREEYNSLNCFRVKRCGDSVVRFYRSIVQE